MTKNKDDQKQRQPKIKKTKNKDNQKRRRPKTKMTKNKDDQKLRQPKIRNFFFHRIHILDQATGIDLVGRLFGSKIGLLGEKDVNGSDDDDDNEDFVSVNEDNTEYISFSESFKL